MMLLPVRPMPVKGESVPGYLLRLAIDNGWDSLSQFLAAYKIKSSKHIDLHNSHLIDAISELLGHTRSSIEDPCLPATFRALKRDENRNFHVLALAEPHVCPLCMKESNSHKTEWQYLPFTHCIKHEAELISKCPHCATEFEWDCALMNGGCSECGATWDAMKSECPSTLPEYLVQFLACNNVEQQQAYLCDLTIAALRVIRPYDELLDITERVVHCNASWFTVFSKAYALLTDVTVIEDHFRACAWVRSRLEGLGSNAVYAPILVLQKELKGNWLLCTYKPDMLKTHVECTPCIALGLSPRPSRTRYLADKDIDLKLQTQTDLSGLAAIMGCDSTDISALSECGIINPLNRTRTSRNSIYNIEEISKQFSVPLLESNDKALTRLNDLEYLLPLHNANWCAVLTGIADRKLSVYRTVSSTSYIDSLYVNKNDLMQFLQAHFYASHDEKVSITSASKILRVPISKFKDMAKAGILFPQRWFSCDVYLVSDLIQVSEQYLIISRCSKVHGIAKATLKERAASIHASPIIGNDIFRRSNEIDSAVLLPSDILH